MLRAMGFAQSGIRERGASGLQSSTWRIFRPLPPSHEPVDAHSVIHRIAVPACDGRAGVDRDASFFVLPWKFVPVIDRLAVARRDAVEALTVWFQEANRAVVQYMYLDFALVHRTVVEPAERHEIRQLRLAAVSPVMNVMCIDVARIAAAWKAATFVTRAECAL